MTAGSTPYEKVMIADAGHGVGPELASLLAGRGLDVIAWAPSQQSARAGEDDGGVRWTHVSSVEAMDPGMIGSTGAVIFNASALDEADLIASGRLADAIAADSAFFLHSLQTIARAMMGNGHGQIWVLVPDDSFAYYLPLAFAPVTHHTRIGAIRALAKELVRFGVCANAAVLQPTLEAVDPADWQGARAGVGSYAQKFKPVSFGLVADTLAFWLTHKTLPMNGSVVHFGNGVYDGNF